MRSNNIHSVGGRLARAAILLVAFAAFATPAAAAQQAVSGLAHTQVGVQGSGAGELTHQATRMDWYPRSLASDAVPVIEAARIVVTMREVKLVTIAGIYSQSIAQAPEKVADLTDARLELSAVGGRSRISLVENGTLVSHTNTANHFEVSPPLPIDSERAVGSRAPQSWERFFDRRPDDLQLQQQTSSTRGQGNFSLLVANATFTIRSNGERAAFEAFSKDAPVSAPGARVTTTRTYIVDVHDGSFDTTPVGGRSNVRASEFQGAFVGSVVVEAAHGSVQTPGGVADLTGQRLDLGGDIDLVLRSAMGDGAPSLELEFDQRDAGLQELRGASTPNLVSGSGWALPVSVAGAVALVGVALTVSPIRHARNARISAAAATPQAPEPQAASPTAAFEDAFRAEPGNIQRAMELALHYASTERYQDALPLLLLTVRNFPKSDVARYTTALALLHVERIEEAVDHLDYAFRLNPLNVARFVKEGPAHLHGRRPQIEALLSRWARVYQESSSRGYA